MFDSILDMPLLACPQEIFNGRKVYAAYSTTLSK